MTTEEQPSYLKKMHDYIVRNRDAFQGGGVLLFPKPTKRVKKKKRLNPRGDKVEVWEMTREILKERFQAAGITSCELRYPGCWRNNALSFAHSKKRRYITSQEVLEEVCLCCTSCHQKIEFRADMYQIVRKVITSRKVAV
jgi:hypothetical protein